MKPLTLRELIDGLRELSEREGKDTPVSLMTDVSHEWLIDIDYDKDGIVLVGEGAVSTPITHTPND